MNAILWKKLKGIYNQKFKLAILLLLPIILCVFLITNPIAISNLSISLPLLNIILCWWIMFNIEDFVYAEVVFGTGITIGDMWLINVGSIIVTGFAYTVIQFVFVAFLANMYQQITFIIIFQMLISFIIGIGFVCFSTYYICDYSQKKNYISSIGGILAIVTLAYILTTYGKVPFIRLHLIPIAIVSLILTAYSIDTIYKRSNIEKFVNNIRKLSDRYDTKNYIDE